MAIAATVQQALETKGIPYEVMPHPKAESSMEHAAAAHIPPDHIAKAVMVKDAEGYVMVVVPGNYWVRLHTLHEELGRELELAEEAEVLECFPDCQAGAIPPLGAQYGVETVLDEALVELANVFFEGGDHQHLIHVSGDDFLQLLGGARRGYFSHNKDSD